MSLSRQRPSKYKESTHIGVKILQETGRCRAGEISMCTRIFVSLHIGGGGVTENRGTDSGTIFQ